MAKKRVLKDYSKELVNFCSLMSDRGLTNGYICDWFNINYCKFSLIKNNKANMTNNFKMLLTLYVNMVDDMGVDRAIKEIKLFNSGVKND